MLFGKRKWVVLALGILLCGIRSFGQCVAGDILWVVETVNANVGTGAASGASAQCAARTVAGAAYNNAGQPFGLQAAFDCACPGSEIRIQAGVNNYDSTTASWTNRLAGSEIQIPGVIASLAGNGPLRVIGYSGGAPCESLQTAGCPVALDFTTGTLDGFDNTAGGNTGLAFIGLHIMNATQRCFGIDSAPSTTMLSVEASGCGTTGIDFTGGTGVNLLFPYMHGNTGDGMIGPSTTQSVLFAEAHDNGLSGIGAKSVSIFERFLAYDNTGGGVGYSGAGAAQIMYGTMARNGTDGWEGGTGQKPQTGGWNLISTGNTAWGMQDYHDPTLVMTLLQCWVAGGNGVGAIDPATSAQYGYGIGGFIDTTTIPTFSSNTNFAVSGVAACSYTYPGTTTTSTSCPGASPSCQGAGLFIQPVR